MCDNRRPRFLGQVGVFMFAEKRLRQSFWIAAAFLFSNPRIPYPPAVSGKAADCPLAAFKVKPGCR